MKTLELKEIAGYLPYGLLWLSDETETCVPTVHDKNFLRLKDIARTEDKPILRPMSDLTREITHKGEKLVPIVELAKIVWTKSEEMWRVDDEELGAGDEYLRLRFTSGCFVIEGVESNNDYSDTPADVFKLFDLLNEWMFDYRYLIGQGLAIDVSTLKDNCYE